MRTLLVIVCFTVFAAPSVFSQPAEAQACFALKHKGDPATRACFEQLIRASDAAVKAEGLWGTGDFRSANDAFRAAVKNSEKDPSPRTRWGRMYLEHWQPSDAADLFNEALAIKSDYAPALLGLGLVAGENFEGKAIEFAERALKADPKLFEAHELIARVALEDNNPKKAEEAARKALEINGEALEALAVLATMDFLNDKQESPWMKKILGINPRYGEGYALAGHFFVINRRYEEGIAMYQKGLALDPALNEARSKLGLTLMNLGREGEARTNLEQAYGAGYQDPQTVNTLKLMDTYKDFVTTETPRTVLKLHKKEAALLRPYFQSEFDRALTTFEKKYKYKLTKQVQLEVFPNHDDFAVRTMGMPGLGALGVTFGQTVAMDSPSGRPPGQWHWASTMWHELSHVYVLTMTQHRVPRWFTEGLAVYEETAASPDWGDRLDPPTIDAIKNKKLLPIAELDRGFIHPTYPAQVTVSYFQGGKICGFIAEKWGFDTLLAMIHDFAAKMSTVDVIEKELHVKPEEFDKQFLAWLDPQVSKTVGHFDEWRKQIRALSDAAKARKWDDVIQQGPAVRDGYAEYVEAGSVYELMANAYLSKNDKAKATAELEKYSRIGGRDPVLLKQLSALQSELGKKDEAAATLERLNLIFLQDDGAHLKLGELYLELGKGDGAIREYQAVLAGKPIDVAGAHYGLARAFVAAKRLPEAKDAVFAALEAAPGFKPAQKLLIELSEKVAN